VAAAATAGRVSRLWVEERRRDRAEVAAIVETLDPGTVKVVPDVRAMAETDSPQGVVAECEPILPVSLDEMAGPGTGLVVLDHIEDPHNVGAAARSALAAGMTGMVVSSRRAAPLSATAFKAAAGALEMIPVAVVGSIPEALSRLKSHDVWSVGLEADSSTSLFGLAVLTEPVAVVIGAEGSGLSELVRKRCDVLASIPMARGTESLNASVSAAVACFEVMRVRSQASL
jgi:23S rRNA (guanosine2251-2'-O)-methyltransferase